MLGIGLASSHGEGTTHMSPWFVYILECRDGSLYTGIAINVDERVKKHNCGQGAKYTSGRGPVKLAFSERFGTHKDAARREAEIKKWNRKEKLQFIQEQID